MTQGAGDFLGWVLDICERFDDFFEGKRAILLGFLVVASALGGRLLDALLVDAWGLPVPPFAAGLTGLLAIVAALLSVGRFLSFRDDERRWSAEVALRRVSQAFALAWNAVLVFAGMPGHEKLSVLGRVGAALALLVLSALNIDVFLRAAWLLASGDAPNSVREWADASTAITVAAWLALVVSLALLGLGWWKRKDSPLAKAIQATKVHAQHGVASSAFLPPVVDCNRDDVGVLAARVPDPVLADFLRALADWKPPKGKAETDYQLRLLKHLQGTALTHVRREPRLNQKADRTHDKPDFLIEEHLLVEMKAQLSQKSEADRALGQLQRYCFAWSGKPVVLLLCDYRPSPHAEFLIRALQQFRQQSPVSVLIARC